jgi:hypothetical protein
VWIVELGFGEFALVLRFCSSGRSVNGASALRGVAGDPRVFDSTSLGDEWPRDAGGAVGRGKRDE